MLQATLAEGKSSHHCAGSPSLFTFNGFFCHFTVECGFPPKIRRIFGVVLAEWSIKALGAIRFVINPISTDGIVVDHMTLLLMGSTGRHLEVFIIPWNVVRWNWGPNSDRKSLDFFIERCRRTSREAPIYFTYLRVNNKYILLDVLLCSIAEYFYELCRILASP